MKECRFYSIVACFAEGCGECFISLRLLASML